MPKVLDQAQAEGWALTHALERLLQIEVTATKARRLAGRFRFANLPTGATLDDLDHDDPAGSTRPCSPSWPPAGPTLLIIDELGYLPLPCEAASALFHVINQR